MGIGGKSSGPVKDWKWNRVAGTGGTMREGTER
jgi:hypothetical protein